MVLEYIHYYTIKESRKHATLPRASLMCGSTRREDIIYIYIYTTRILRSAHAVHAHPRAPSAALKRERERDTRAVLCAHRKGFARCETHHRRSVGRGGDTRAQHSLPHSHQRHMHTWSFAESHILIRVRYTHAHAYLRIFLRTFLPRVSFSPLLLTYFIVLSLSRLAALLYARRIFWENNKAVVVRYYCSLSREQTDACVRTNIYF